MRPLEQEHDIEKLRQAALLLERENQRLAVKVAELTRQLLVAQGNDRAQLELKLMELEHQLQLQNKRLHGQSTERSPRAPDEAAGSRSKPQQGHGPREQKQLELIEVEHKLDAADEQCPACGGELQPWEGQFEESEQIDVIERRFVLKKHKRQKYRCTCCAHIDTALGPKKLQSGGRYSPAFAIDVAISKHADHIPLERQVKIMAREGLEVDSQTLWDQIERLAKLLQPAYEALGAHARAHGVIGADETTWWRMRGRGEGPGASERHWLWTIVGPDVVFQRIDGRRSAEAAKQLLGEYAGTIMCDGLASYSAFAKHHPDVKLAHCWAHVRRAFIEARDLAPEAVDRVLEHINALFAIEREAATGPPDRRLALRREKSTPHVEAIAAFWRTYVTLPQSTLGKAITYVSERWNGLVRFLDDARVPLDNNASERALRGPVVGRKNFRGSRSQRGMETAALYYSLIETAKRCGLDPRAYLRQAVDAALDAQPIPLPHQLAPRQN
jgi:transposase